MIVKRTKVQIQTRCWACEQWNNNRDVTKVASEDGIRRCGRRRRDADSNGPRVSCSYPLDSSAVLQYTVLPSRRKGMDTNEKEIGTTGMMVEECVVDEALSRFCWGTVGGKPREGGPARDTEATIDDYKSSRQCSPYHFAHSP